MEENIEVICLQTIEEFDRLEDDWMRIHAESPQSGLFNTWYWRRLWWEHYGDIGELFIVVAKVNGVVEAIAPLYRLTTTALKFAHADTIRFIGCGGNTSPDDLDVVINPNAGESLINTMTAYIMSLKEVGRLQLSDLPENSPFLKAILNHVAKAGWSIPLLQNQPRRVQKLSNTIASYEKTISRNARKQRKRRRKRLAEAGEYTYHLCRTPEEVELAFVELANLHQTRHASKGEQGSFGSERYCNFHLALMKEAMKRDELRLYVLVLNEETVGIEYAYFCNRKLMFFQNGFDPKFESLSPGHLLMSHIIDESIKEGAESMDLLKGNYEYKASYAKEQVLSVSVDLWRSQLMTMANRAVRSIRAA